MTLLTMLHPGESSADPLVPPPTPCVYTVTVGTQIFGAAGGTTPVTIQCQEGCRWTIVDNADWLSVSPNAGTGPKTAILTVRGFVGTGSRTTTVVAAGYVFAVKQLQD